MKTALKAGEKDRLTVIRMVLANIQRREVDDRVELDDAGILQVINKLVKQGQESAQQFADGGRDDLAQKGARRDCGAQDLFTGAANRGLKSTTLIVAAIKSTGSRKYPRHGPGHERDTRASPGTSGHEPRGKPG